MGHIPRHDRADDPHRRLAHVGLPEHPLAPLDPRILPRGRRCHSHHRRRAGGLSQPAEASGGAHLGGDQIGHLIQMTGIDGRELLDLLDPLERTQPRPRAVVEGLAGGRYRPVHVLGSGIRNLTDRLLGVWRDDREPPRGGRRLPPTCNEKVVIGK